ERNCGLASCAQAPSRHEGDARTARVVGASICRRSIQFGRLRLPKEPRQFLGLRETQRLGEEFPSGVRVRVHRRREGPWEEYSNGPEAQGNEQVEMPQDEHSK